MSDQTEQNPASLISAVKNALGSSLSNALKFSYGYLFGWFVWSIMVQPYGRFFDFQHDSYLPEFLFCLSIAAIFMSFLWIRAVMVLFLPSLIGNASQNYVIILLFILIFTNPVSNIALNAVESIRVIGCSLTLAYQHLSERVKLILSPLLEILNDPGRSDFAPIEQDLMDVQQIVLDMRREAEFNNHDDDLEGTYTTRKSIPQADKRVIVDELKKHSNVDSDITREIANKTRELVEDSSLDFDSNSLGLKASVDLKKLRRLYKSNNQATDFNLTKVLHENCLGIFRKAKSNCEKAVEEMRLSCANIIGSFLSALWCSPVTLGLSSLCPWIMNQIVDENSLCNQLQNSTTSINVNALEVSGDINAVYKNLTNKVFSLNEEISSKDNDDATAPQRLELSITFNNQTRGIFMKARDMIRFIQDKYRIRKFFFDILLFIYEVYTTITFLSIMKNAYKYHKSYLNQIKYDNYYVTNDFVKADERRRALGKPTVLPLTKDESERYITTFTCKRRTSEEKKTQTASCIMIILFLGFTLSLIYFDSIVYSILDSIHDHALVRFKEVGHHKLDVKVLGQGAIARLVRRITARLNTVYDLDRLSSTRECLPVARETSGGFYLEFLYLVVIYLAIDQISIYSMRMRHLTSAFFYPEKERQRIVYLYGSILMQRQSAERMGLRSYIEEVEKGEDDEDVFTLRDAFKYIKNCVSDSISCCHRSRR